MVAPHAQQVALLRNVNQGQRGHPTTAMILAAFASAGCDDVSTFQSNGTVVFRSDDPRDAVDDAVIRLCDLGYPRDCFTVPASDLAEIVRAYAGSPESSRLEITLHGTGTIDRDDAEVAREAARRRCRLVASGPGWVVSLNERERESNATPVVERITGGPATSRSMGTMRRLLDRHDSSDEE